MRPRSAGVGVSRYYPLVLETARDSNIGGGGKGQV